MKGNIYNGDNLCQSITELYIDFNLILAKAQHDKYQLRYTLYFAVITKLETSTCLSLIYSYHIILNLHQYISLMYIFCFKTQLNLILMTLDNFQPSHIASL